VVIVECDELCNGLTGAESDVMLRRRGGETVGEVDWKCGVGLFGSAV